jgi:hypothetical protein
MVVIVLGQQNRAGEQYGKKQTFHRHLQRAVNYPPDEERGKKDSKQLGGCSLAIGSI